jgi:hypothetical protein
MDFESYRLRIRISRLPSILFYILSFGYVFRRYFLTRNAIVIISPGKVGSGSLYYHVKSSGQRNAFHIHYLSRLRIKEEFVLERSGQRKSAPWHLYVSYWLSLFMKITPKKSLKIVILTRELSTRYVSSIFQNIGRLYSEIFSLNSGEINNEKLLDYIITNATKDISSIESYLNTELIEFLGIEFSSLEMHKLVSTKYGIAAFTNLFESPSVDLLAGYLGIECSDIHKTNVASAKFYSNEYKQLRDIALKDISPLYININKEFKISR